MSKSSMLTDELLFSSLFDALSEEDILASALRHDISKSIIKHRLSLGMNQKEYAKKLGVSQGMVSKWESGDYNFSTSSLAKIAIKTGLKLVNPLRELYASDKKATACYEFSISNATDDKNHSSTEYSDWTNFGGIAS